MTGTHPISRRLQQGRRDAWLIDNRALVAAESLNAIARELRSIGLYSSKTSLVDIRVRVASRCRALGLATRMTL